MNFERLTIASLPYEVRCPPLGVSSGFPSDGSRLTASLPQILVTILAPLPTPYLLPLAAVDRRFHAVVLRLLHRRVLHAATVPGHQLVLECYHPSAQFSTPSLQCGYLGTAGLGWPLVTSEAVLVQGDPEAPGLAQLRTLYSRFRVSPQDENRRGRRRHPLQSSSLPTPPDVASHMLHLDDDESFSQLCTATHILRLGAVPGQVLGSATINDGVIRVWRDWLATRAACTQTAAAEPECDGDVSILWTDPARHVGLRFRVIETTTSGRPVLVRADEETPVSYRLDYEGELARTPSRGYQADLLTVK